MAQKPDSGRRGRRFKSGHPDHRKHQLRASLPHQGAGPDLLPRADRGAPGKSILTGHSPRSPARATSNRSNAAPGDRGDSLPPTPTGPRSIAGIASEGADVACLLEAAQHGDPRRFDLLDMLTAHGLIAAIQEEFTDGFRAEYGQRLSSSALPEGAGAVDAIGLAVRGLAETFQAHEKLLRVFAVLGLRDKPVFEVGSRASHEGGRLFRELLWPYRNEFTGDNPETAVDFAQRLVYAACMHRVLHGPNLESPTSMTWEQLIRQLCRATVLYLLGAVPRHKV